MQKRLLRGDVRQGVGLPILSLYSLSSLFFFLFLETYRGDPNPNGRSVFATTTAKTDI
jgi:hypothetical protein